MNPMIGGEDDDASLRVRCRGYNIGRPSAEFARYTMLKHGRDKNNPKNPERFGLMDSATDCTRPTNGLDSVFFSIVDHQLRSTYTWILVDLGNKTMTG